MQRTAGILSFLVILSGCRSSTDPQAGRILDASLAMLFAPDGPLTGEPNLYEFHVAEGNNARPILRSGDLPRETGIVTLDNLPATELATITGGLYLDNITPATKTHVCNSPDPFSLVSGETQSISIGCYPVNNSGADEAVEVFIKVASVNVSLEEAESGDLLENRDWSAPAQFAQFDTTSRKITMQTHSNGTYLHIGGHLSYFAPPRLTDSGSPLLYAMIFEGETLSMQAVSGINLPATPDDAVLSVSGPPSFFEESGVLKMLIPIALENSTGTVRVAGNLLEEAAQSEFTVVSYNVENLFDTTDDERNSGYGDYRISPNDRGYFSNWGEMQVVDGVNVSFTDIKIANILKALEAIEAGGPAVVGLQEIESKAALDLLLEKSRHLGYVAAQFTEWPLNEIPNAVGLGVLSKFPIKSWKLISVDHPAGLEDQEAPREPMRRILKVVLDVMGHDLIVYNNHWKSKGGPESWRMESAKALQADIEADAAVAGSSRVDYIILGDLNSDHNENAVIEDRHNDTDGLTGINTILRAAGDELNTLRERDRSKFNLHYERERSERRTAWHEGFGWSSMDHIIIGSGMYDAKGITYVDNSFQPPSAGLPRLNFLFNEDGTTNRWIQLRDGNITRHMVGGYSDHAPLSARFEIRRLQSPRTIWLHEPAKPDATDIPLPH